MSGEQLAAMELEHRWQAVEKRCAELKAENQRLLDKVAEYETTPVHTMKSLNEEREHYRDRAHKAEAEVERLREMVCRAISAVPCVCGSVPLLSGCLYHDLCAKLEQTP